MYKQDNKQVSYKIPKKDISEFEEESKLKDWNGLLAYEDFDAKCKLFMDPLIV